MSANVIPFTQREKPQPLPRLRDGVPPFDPMNPAHLRAWEAIWDFGKACERGWGDEKLR